MYSLIIPVYRNEENLPRLLRALTDLSASLSDRLEVVFVVDGSPDRCREILAEKLGEMRFFSRLVWLSRNFGSFSAIRAGLEAGSGEHFAVMAADLQEPPSLILQFFESLERGEADLVLGQRLKRADPLPSHLFSNVFWRIYRRFVIPSMPPGGVDVFGCTRLVRDRLMEFHETPTNLVALLLWLGFRRKFIGYERAGRREGKSAWTVRKKIQYSLDSIFNFTDLPIRVLLYVGVLGIVLSLGASAIVMTARLLGWIAVPGYTAIVLAILFFGALTSLGLGIIGQYLWLSLQNSRQRPGFIIAGSQAFAPGATPAREEPPPTSFAASNSQ